MVVFIIFIALKNRARNRPVTNIERTSDTDQKTGEETDKLSRYMEELLGIDRTEAKPQTRIKRKTQKTSKERATPREELEVKQSPGRFESSLAKEHRVKRKQPLPEKRGMHHAQFPWGTLSKKDLPGAIILSEIIGPPVSKRKSHRLF